MSDPTQPLPGDLEQDVQRTKALLDQGSHDPLVILRALVLTAQTKSAPPSMVDQFLHGQAPMAPPPGAQPFSGPQPFYGPPNVAARPHNVPPPPPGPQNF